MTYPLGENHDTWAYRAVIETLSEDMAHPVSGDMTTLVTPASTPSSGDLWHTPGVDATNNKKSLRAMDITSRSHRRIQ